MYRIELRPHSKKIWERTKNGCFVVRSIVDDAEHYLGEPVEEAALSSYFNTKVEQLFLIFDFGGGTLDISIVDCFDTMVEIVSVPEITALAEIPFMS